MYKNNKNIVVISNNGLSNPIFYVLKNDFDISSYLNKIVNNSDESISHNDQGLAEEVVAVDTTAVAVDSAATSYYE